ncbi:hypothetical protein ACFLWI_04145 [Chloroflexota bacterium]
MLFNGPPPAFIIMTYMMGLMAVSLALVAATRWFELNILVLPRPRITLSQLGLLFFLGTIVVSIMVLVNLLIGVGKHVLDYAIVYLLIIMHAFPSMMVPYLWRRARL